MSHPIARPIPITATVGTDQTIAQSTNGSAVYLGATVKETGGTAAGVVTIYDGATTGPILSEFELAANASDKEWLGPQGIRAATGIIVVRVTGVGAVVAGSVRVA